MDYGHISGIFHLKSSDWLQDLERLKFSRHWPAGENTYICSPLGDASKENIYYNMLSARFYMYWLMRNYHRNAVAPHAYLPILCDDTLQKDRELALDFGQKLLLTCKEIYVCGEVISSGMELEIFLAAESGMTIHTFHADVHETVLKICMGMRSTSKIGLTAGSPFGLDRKELRSWGIFNTAGSQNSQR